MQFHCSREELLKAIAPTTGVVETRQTLPILGHLHLEVTKDRVILTGTDLEVALKAWCPAQVEELGEATVPARKFLELTRSLPEGADLQLGQADGQVWIQTKRSRFGLATLPPDDFPELELGDSVQEVPLSQGVLKRLLGKTSFAMARDDVRYYLNGILLEWTETNLRAVATDGHRLALMDHEVAPAENPVRVILPRKGVRELERLLTEREEELEVGFAPNHVRFRLPRLTCTSKLIEGQFPDYQRVIPTMEGSRLQGDRQAILQALKRVAILSHRKTRRIRLNCRAEHLEISAENPDQEQANEEIPISYDGEPLEIGFNVEYLLHAVGAIPTSEVCFYFQDSQSSCLVVPAGEPTVKYVIMPMHL